MRTAFTGFFFALTLGLVALVPRAEAQETTEYTQAIKLGSSEFAAGNYAEARAQFTRAHEEFPNARTLRALGMVEFELRNYLAAFLHLDQALESAVRPLDDEKRAHVEQLRKQAHGYVGRYTLRVSPSNASLELDEVPTTTDGSGAILVQVGDHALQVSAPGHRSTRRALHVAGGEDATLAIVLNPSGATGEHSDARASEEAAPHKLESAAPFHKKWWLWTAVSIVVVGAAAGATVALTRDHREPAPVDGGSRMSVLRGPNQ